MVHCYNATAVSIANKTVKRQRLQSMEMRYFWVCDKISQDAYNVKWYPGQEILLITKASTNLGCITRLYASGTCTHKKHPQYYQGQPDLALWKGVLELSLRGTYVMYPYLKSLEHRVPSQEYRYSRYLITTRPHTQFLCTLALVAGLRIQHMHTHLHGMLLPLITRTNLLPIFLMAIAAILDSQHSLSCSHHYWCVRMLLGYQLLPLFCFHLRQ